jgi:hypothetical protein
LNDDLRKAYELLGVKPGVSNRELKAAHRDLAKVWHPDRFLHDPRLQDKAQEKLKEINEAYELLSSGRMPRSAPAPTTYSQPQQPTPRRSQRGFGRVAVPLLLFVAVFAITTRYLLQQRSRPLPDQEAQVEQAEVAERPTVNAPDANVRSEASRKANREGESAPEANSTTEPTTTSDPTASLATVTVAIDPESGLLARPDCPLRSRMTYPHGSEPSSYCKIVHAPPPKESRIKSIAKGVGRALD